MNDREQHFQEVIENYKALSTELDATKNALQDSEANVSRLQFAFNFIIFGYSFIKNAIRSYYQTNSLLFYLFS